MSHCTVTALASVRAALSGAVHAAGRPANSVRLVAVSKYQPLEKLEAAYGAGHRDFGENYVQELVNKASQMPGDVRWRFIGRLQSNKVKMLLSGVPSLAAVETVDSAKLARRLNRVRGEIAPGGDPLGVMVQMNTSGEASKAGLGGVEECVELASLVAGDECPALRLDGLMTIGEQGSRGCLEQLVECRSQVCAALAVPPDALELSMGMSGDFELAVELGSTNVRVGSTVFGARPAPSAT